MCFKIIAYLIHLLLSDVSIAVRVFLTVALMWSILDSSFLKKQALFRDGTFLPHAYQTYDPFLLPDDAFPCYTVLHFHFSTEIPFLVYYCIQEVKKEIIIKFLFIRMAEENEWFSEQNL